MNYRSLSVFDAFLSLLCLCAARVMPVALMAILLLTNLGCSDAEGDDFPEVTNNETANDDQPMPAAEAAASMQLPAGFEAQVFASEPDVRNPIAMAWDDQQRMWVAENYTYSDRKQHFDLSLRDRVIVLKDTNGDGKADQRQVFTDQVQMLTSVEVGRGGVWLMCPPQLLFIPDADGDAKPDGPAQVVLDGFTVSSSNYHNFANGLRWGPDGWLYGRCGHSCPGRIGAPGTLDEQRVPIDGGIWRYHPQHKTVEVLTHGTVNPWGHDWDKNGELFFINTVIGHLWHCIPGAHFIESFGESRNPFVFERLDMIADHYHYDRNGSWQQSRDGAANDLGGGHAHIGMMIYQSDRWPAKYHDKLFTLNQHGKRANVESLRRQGSGYVGSHEPDFMLAKDAFFRGLEIQTGPDGDAYVLDWSDTGECHDHTGVHRTSGRIYKLHYQRTPGDKRAVDQTQRFAKPMCLAGSGKLPDLWLDYQAGKVTTERLHALLDDPNENVRVWAIRLLTDRWPLDTLMGPMKNVKYPDDQATYQQLLRVAKHDSSGLVKLALASTLQRLPLEKRSALATLMVSDASLAEDRDLPAMVWFGLMPLVDGDLEGLASVAADCTWPNTLTWITRGLVSKCNSDPEALAGLLKRAETMPAALQLAVLMGMDQQTKGWLRAQQPEHWTEFKMLDSVAKQQAIVARLSQLFGDGLSIDQLRQLVLSKKQPLQTRMEALQSLINARPKTLRSICESLITEREINAVAARGLALSNDPRAAERLANAYRRFHPNDREGLIEILASRPVFAHALLDQLDAAKDPIPSAAVNAFHARQILAFDDPELSAKLTAKWGSLRETSEERQELIDQWKEKLTAEVLAGADLAKGRQRFTKTCSQCHRLFGQGEQIGPDLTGSQRQSLDYLLINLLDPSAVVGKDHRMTVVVTEDGRVLNGLLVSKNDQTLVLQTPTRRETLPTQSIETMKQTMLSPMPEGMLNSLSDAQVRDLIAYLQSPVQVR